MRRLFLPLLLVGWFAPVSPAGAASPSDDAGAGWAFRPAVPPPVPDVAGEAVNPIDAFLLRRLRERGLDFRPEADRATLLRRVTFDLTGLPPTPEEIDAFLNDDAPDAYERVVERLLASPRFGERAALFWLDLVRFAETDGFKADDPRPTAWRYRDYVIRSFNEDKPYDRFVREQIAGDELYPGNPEALIATAMHRHYPDEYNAVNLEQRRQEILNDITDTTAQVFLGLTMGCAKCHDHKYDPISQRDYYRMQAFFAAWWPAEAPLVGPEELAAYRAEREEWLEKTEELRRKLAEIEKPYRERHARKQRSRFPPEYAALLDVPPEERTPLQKQIAVMVERQVYPEGLNVAGQMKGPERERWRQMTEKLRAVAEEPGAPPRGMVFAEVGPTAPATRLLAGGNWRRPGEELKPGFLSALGGQDAAVTPRAESTGRRAALAEWLTRPDHPLTARVMANRIWQQHFVEGIVRTPSDFGAQGERPTHPQLLDWLAAELTGSGWSLKHLHRLMVTSRAYRQGNGHDGAAAAADPENRLLWRMNRRRLEGETLRDAILAVNGTLNPRMGGPSVFPELPAELKG
ncbi:MAG TPA: DUF1549 and DUF1553 domain-containing protein, partial [Gemmataceae bacterium]